MNTLAREPGTRELSRGALQTLVLRLGGGALEFLLNLVVARVCGAAGAGLFHSAITAANVASVFARLGLDNTVLRRTAAHAAAGEEAALRGVVAGSARLALATSAVAALLLVVLAAWLARSVPSVREAGPLLQLAALGVLPLSLACLHGEALKALRRVAASQFVSAMLLPGVACVAALLLAPRFGAGGAVLAWVLGAFVAAGAGALCWRNAMRASPPPAPVASRELLAGSLALLWVTTARLGTGWMATAALLLWSSTADVGVYNVALRLSLALGLLLMAVNSVAAPGFAARVRLGDPAGLQRLARRATVMALVAGGPVALLLLVFPAAVMGLFGADFALAGPTVLQVLVLGQCINLLTGPVAYLLTMSGNEAELQHCMTVAVLAGGLCLLLLQREGALGAAIATTVAMVLQNLGAAWCVWRRLGFVPTPLPLFRSATP